MPSVAGNREPFITEPNRQTQVSVAHGKIFNPYQSHESADTFVLFWCEVSKISDRVKHQRQQNQGGQTNV